jgi:succinate-semialdehyde dehydrogenase / glutarate-semialdehyde dehydrogenase
MSLASINPATGQLIRRYRSHTRAEVDTALDQVARGQRAWRELAVSERARHLRALARRLRQDRGALAAVITAEMGKPITEARAEIEKCAAGCAYYAQHGPAWLKPEPRPGAPKGTFVAFEPLGVLLAIMPWNFPFWQTFRAAAPALLAGNTVLLKHAANVSGCALAIEATVRAAGLPSGVFRAILAESSAVAPLIADRRVNGVTLTGSTAAGKAVAAQAGAALKPCVLELGGADSYIVLEDADLDRAATTLAAGRLVNGGQSCVAAKRFIVIKSVRVEFERKLAAAFQARQTGNPMDPQTDLGPMAREDLRQGLHQQVQRSLRAGARLVMGGRIPAGPAFFYPPTILTNVRPGMPAYHEELFGPVATIISARDEADAIKHANATAYGLGAGVFTRNRARGRDLAVEQLEAGLVFVNDYVRSDPSLPFGGVKESGYGRELSLEGLRSWVNVKTVSVR